ncbi:MAG: hypothetical protein AVDCRST_MAG39-2882, partial [uncultured Sphingomonadaceae bacterium]
WPRNRLFPVLPSTSLRSSPATRRPRARASRWSRPTAWPSRGRTRCTRGH